MSEFSQPSEEGFKGIHIVHLCGELQEHRDVVGIILDAVELFQVGVRHIIAKWKSCTG